MKKLKEWIENNVEAAQSCQHIDDVMLGELIQLGEVAKICGWESLLEEIEALKVRNDRMHNAPRVAPLPSEGMQA